MATKAPLASLYAEEPEEQSLVNEIKGSYDKLRASLSEREKPLLDPVMLAMAQGFLAPTKTGSFGESLGNVAALVGPAQESQDKRAREMAEMRMALAQQELAQRQATRGEREFRGLLGKVQGSEAQIPKAPPVAGDAYMPARQPEAVVQQATQGARDISPQDIARLATVAPDKAKILSDMIKMEQDRYSISMNGIVFDKKNQKYLNLEIPGQKQEPFTTKFGRFEMTPYEYSQYKAAESEGRGKQWVDEFRGVAPTPGAPQAPGAEAPPAGRKTVAQQAAEAEADKVRATKTAEAETSRTQSAIESGSNITDRLASINALKGIVARPDSSQIFGIFNRPDVATAILNLVQEGVRAPGQSTIQAGALEDTLRNVGLPQAQIDRYRFALATMANIQLQQAKLAAGQGSVSNFERDLFSNATLSPKDNPGTIMAKLSMLDARAQFDRQVSSALRKSKMSIDDFKDSDQYQGMVQSYLGRISNISENIGAPSSAPRRAAPGGYGRAGEALRNELGLGAR